MNLLTLYLLLLKATVTTFSGFGSMPLIRNDLVVHRGVLTDEQLNNAIAIGQATPGPLGIYIVIVGYDVAGMAGASLAMLAMATPALLAIPIFRVVQRGRAFEVRGGSGGVVIISCVLMFTAAVQLAPRAIPTPALALLATVSFVLLMATRIPPIAIIALSAACGLLLP